MNKKDKNLTEFEKLARVVRIYLEYLPFVLLLMFIAFSFLSCAVRMSI